MALGSALRLTLLVVASVSAFHAPVARSCARDATALSAHRTLASLSASEAADAEVSRRSSLQRLARAALVSPLIAAAVPATARADGAVEDLDAPSQEEIEKQRLARKLAAQNKDKKSEKKGLAAQLADEQAKEKQLKGKTKQEKREDLCELLGRGC